MKEKALVLVDFDNLEKELRTDLAKLEAAIYSAVSRAKKYDEIRLRLYGGWFHFKNPSIAARHLAPWVYGFPHVIDKTLLNAELARSLGFESHDLRHTFRSRTKKPSIQVNPSKICTSDPSCDLYRLGLIISTGKCNIGSCGKDLSDAFLINEQKLVDTMISTDLIYFSTAIGEDIFLVSSDDDFIPALRYLGYTGHVVRVIHTKTSPYNFNREYTSGYNPNILEGSF